MTDWSKDMEACPRTKMVLLADDTRSGGFVVAGWNTMNYPPGWYDGKTQLFPYAWMDLPVLPTSDKARAPFRPDVLRTDP